MFDFWYFELVPPSVCSGVLPLLCPSCPLSRESSHVVAVLTGWSLTCHLLISSNTRCRCSAPAPVMVYIALTQVVSYAAQAQVLEHFAPASSAYAGRSCEQQQGVSFSPCRAHRLHLHLMVEYIAPAPAVYAAPAPVMVYIALTQAVSYAAQAQVLEYFAPASSAYAGRSCKQQQGVSFSPCRAHRLHLHLWWSTSRRHQQFMLHLRLSWCTLR